MKKILLILFLLYFHNAIGQNSSELNDSTCLIRIDLHNVQLERLPDSIFIYKKIKQISIGHNPKIDWNNVTVQLSNFKSIQTLIIQSQCLEEIPHELMILKNVEVLDLRCNKIQQVSPEIGNMKNLKAIDLSENNLGKLTYNQLDSIFISLSLLPGLEEIMLNDNYLDTLPNSFRNIKNIKKVTIVNNLFLNIPSIFLDCKNLDFISIDCYKSLLNSFYLSRFENITIFLNKDRVEGINIPLTEEQFLYLVKRYPAILFW